MNRDSILKIKLVVGVVLAWFVWGGLSSFLFRGNDVAVALFLFWVGLAIITPIVWR